MLRSESEGQTKEIGRRLAEHLRAGDVVCLYGELGAGKTIMVKGMAPVFGIQERDITSPTFTIIAEHRGTLPFYHIDLYRLDKNSVQEIGLHEYLYGGGISVIEWAERAGEAIPDTSIKVTIRYAGETAREIDIKGVSIPA